MLSNASSSGWDDRESSKLLVDKFEILKGEKYVGSTEKVYGRSWGLAG